MIDIKKPIPVTELQYKIIYKSWHWAAATRKDESGQYWIWIWMPKYSKDILKAIDLES